EKTFPQIAEAVEIVIEEQTFQDEFGLVGGEPLNPDVGNTHQVGPRDAFPSSTPSAQYGGIGFSGDLLFEFMDVTHRTGVAAVDQPLRVLEIEDVHFAPGLDHQAVGRVHAEGGGAHHERAHLQV